MSRFLAYLRGIETDMFGIGREEDHVIFSLPTRNWNLQAWVLLLLRCRFLAYLRGIETNIIGCEFLPFKMIFSLPTRNWNPEGYEGDEMATEIFSLPTRNWNRPLLPCRLSGIAFLAYLRGIETIARFVGGFLGSLIFSLPTRNWNAGVRGMCGGLCSHF